MSLPLQPATATHAQIATQLPQLRPKVTHSPTPRAEAAADEAAVAPQAVEAALQEAALHQPVPPTLATQLRPITFTTLLKAQVR
jgi:hypothetical protein